MLHAGKDVGQRKLEAFELLRQVRLDESCRKTRQDRGGFFQQGFVDDVGLGEVCDLRRAADVSQRGQQKILDDWAHQYVGAEVLGAALDYAEELSAREGLFTRRKYVARQVNGHARIVLLNEQQRGRWRDLYLGVIAGGFEPFAAGEQGGVELARSLNGGLVHRLGDCV